MPNIQLQFRRGTATEWSNANTVLAAGELAIETNTNNFKIGNGSTTWNSLSYSGLIGPTGFTGPLGTGPTGTQGFTGPAGSGGGGGLTTSTGLKGFSETIISTAVTIGSTGAINIESYTIPEGMKGKIGFLEAYFYLSNQTAWPPTTTVSYGFALDSTLLGTMAGRLPVYTHSGTTNSFLIVGPTGTVGTGGITNRLTIPVSVPSNATNFHAVVSNSSSAMVLTQVGAIATTTFVYTTGVAQSYTVPANISSITIHLWGAGGGTQDGSNNASTAVPGVNGNPSRQGSGSGGYTTGKLSVSAGQVLWIVVGTLTGTGGGTLLQGRGGSAVGYGGAGGGFTAIFSSNPTSMTAAQAAAVLIGLAGGGGGAGINGGGLGGGGGGTTGLPGRTTGLVDQTTGGTQTAGGGSGGNAGSLMQGGVSGGGSGGGGGYYGGGGAAGANQAGGGGSGFIGGLTNATTTQGNSAANFTTWAEPPQFLLMRSFMGASSYLGGAYQNGAVAIITEGTFPTYIGSEVNAVY